MSPVQADSVPIASATNAYATEVRQRLAREGSGSSSTRRDEDGWGKGVRDAEVRQDPVQWSSAIARPRPARSPLRRHRVGRGARWPLTHSRAAVRDTETLYSRHVVCHRR